jgi:hypothetical protein
MGGATEITGVRADGNAGIGATVATPPAGDSGGTLLGMEETQLLAQKQPHTCSLTLDKTNSI